MDNIAEWLGNLTWPLVSRVLTALGLGTVTFTGANAALQSALGSAKSALTGMGGEVLQLLAMAGFFEVMAITSGGIVSGLVWMTMKKFALQTTGT